MATVKFTSSKQGIPNHPSQSEGDAKELPSLEIARGRTAQPRRLIRTSRFLIGSSSRCDLRLGGSDIPSLHSMIVILGEEVWLETMAGVPAVLINGQSATSARLADGDRVQIGSFEFVAHCPKPAAAEQTPQRTDCEPAGATSEDAAAEPVVSELSAASLVERIEAATRLVDEFERRERLGVEALLQSLGHRIEGMAAEEVPSARQSLIPIPVLADNVETRMLADLETLVMQLSSIVEELQVQSSLQRRREAGNAHAVSSLLEMQDRLSRQLESLLRHVASLRQNRSDYGSNRAIA